MAIKLVDEGLARMRDNCQDQKLKDAQEAATAANKVQTFRKFCFLKI